MRRWEVFEVFHVGNGYYASFNGVKLTKSQWVAWAKKPHRKGTWVKFIEKVK